MGGKPIERPEDDEVFQEKKEIMVKILSDLSLSNVEEVVSDLCDGIEMRVMVLIATVAVESIRFTKCSNTMQYSEKTREIRPRGIWTFFTLTSKIS